MLLCWCRSSAALSVSLLFWSQVIIFRVEFHLIRTSWIIATGSCLLCTCSCCSSAAFAGLCLKCPPSLQHFISTFFKPLTQIAVSIDFCELCAMHSMCSYGRTLAAAHHIPCTVCADCCDFPCNVWLFCIFRDAGHMFLHNVIILYVEPLKQRNVKGSPIGVWGVQLLWDNSDYLLASSDHWLMQQHLHSMLFSFVQCDQRAISLSHAYFEFNFISLFHTVCMHQTIVPLGGKVMTSHLMPTAVCLIDPSLLWCWLVCS